MTPAAKLREQLEVVSIVAGIGLTAWLIWTMTPETVRRPLITRVMGPFASIVAERAAAAARQREVRQMEFETFALLEVVSAYDVHRDTDQLARDLEAASAHR